MTITMLFRLGLLLSCWLTSQGCKTAQFDTTWKSDTNTWKKYALNGVEFQIPSEFPVLKVNSNTWWFVIEAKQVDSFSEGVSRAIHISIVSPGTLSREVTIKQIIQSIEDGGGKIFPVEKPIKGTLYFHPDSYEGKRTRERGLEGTVIRSSSFGYVFPSGSEAIVRVKMFKLSHHPVTYEQWRPETDIFNEKERRLVEQITALCLCK